MKQPSDLRMLAVGTDHSEGVALGPDGFLYAGGEAGQIYRIDPAAGSFEQIADTGGFVLGVALDAAGRIYVCDAGSASILRIGLDGTIETYCERSSGEALMIPNWLAFAPDGSLLFTDSGTEGFELHDGRVVRVPAGGGDGETLELGRPVHFPNGLAVQEDGSFYVLETFTPRLSRWTEAAGLETLLDLPGTAPDGLALTADGGLVIAFYHPYRLMHLPAGATTPEMLLDDTVGLSLPNPTNVAFYGEDMRSLAIAAHGGQFVAGLDDLPFAGAPLFRP